MRRFPAGTADLAAAVFLRAAGTAYAYRFRMCSGADGELTGQISINELLIAMGEAPIEPLPPVPAPPGPSSPSEPPALPGL